MSESKFCILNPHKNSVAITLKGEPHIRAGADLKIYNEEKKSIYNFKLKIENGDSDVHKIDLPLSELNKKRLVWQIACCSSNENIFIGKVELKITQSALPAKVTGSTSYIINNLPPCKLKGAERITNNLFFIVKE